MGSYAAGKRTQNKLASADISGSFGPSEKKKFALVRARLCSRYLDNIEQQISVRATSVEIKIDH